MFEEIKARHEAETAMDSDPHYNQWSQPALAGRLRQSNRDRAWLIDLISELKIQLKVETATKKAAQNVCRELQQRLERVQNIEPVTLYRHPRELRVGEHPHLLAIPWDEFSKAIGGDE